MNRQRARRQEGFSILEVYIAGALLSIVAFSAMLTLIPVSRSVRLNAEMDTVSNQIKDAIERVQVTPFNEILTTFPPGSSIPLEDVESGTILVSYEDPAADPLQVRMTVAWSSPDVGPMQRVFATVRTE